MAKLNIKDSPKFENPPVIEVAITAQFTELDNKSFLTDIDKIWDKLGKENYPEIHFKNRKAKLSDRNKQVHFALVDSEDDFEFPRMWFESADECFVIQMQPDRLSVNWRRLEKKLNKESSDYSSFETVWKHFSNALDIFSNFSKAYCKSSLNINFLELSYINVIPFSDFGGAAKINNCIPALSLENTPSYLGVPQSVNFLWEMPIDNDCSKFFIQGLTHSSKKTGEKLLRLDLTEKGAVDLNFDNDSKGIHNWFADAHLRIVNCFKDITHVEMHKKWRIK